MKEKIMKIITFLVILLCGSTSAFSFYIGDTFLGILNASLMLINIAAAFHFRTTVFNEKLPEFTPAEARILAEINERRK